MARRSVNKSMQMSGRISEYTTDERTVDFIEKQLKKGKSKAEIVQEACMIWSAFRQGKLLDHLMNLGIIEEKPDDEKKENTESTYYKTENENKDENIEEEFRERSDLEIILNGDYRTNTNNSP